MQRAGLNDRKWAQPVFETFALALPRAYESVRAPEGTEVCIIVAGPSGGAWSIRRAGARWRIVGEGERADAEVRIPEELAWRLFTRMVDPEAASSGIRRRGTSELTEPACRAVAIMTTSA